MTSDPEHKSGERIAKVIARAGLASRREAEEWIAAGRVAVNGAVIDSPALNVTATDRISVDGAALPGRERTRLFLYHKPRGLLTTRVDPRGRPTIFEKPPPNLPRLISVGRLDFNTEGLLLLTNDGALARVLELPATGWLRRYRVRAHGAVNQAQLDQLRKGVTISGIRYGAIKADLERVQSSNLWLGFAIREGKNREVRNVLGHLGLTVTRLIRVLVRPVPARRARTGRGRGSTDARAAGATRRQARLVVGRGFFLTHCGNAAATARASNRSRTPKFPPRPSKGRCPAGSNRQQNERAKVLRSRLARARGGSYDQETAPQISRRPARHRKASTPGRRITRWFIAGSQGPPCRGRALRPASGAATASGAA